MTDLLDEAPLGTVIRSDWDIPYYKAVLRVEQEAQRAICGAPKKDGKPCKGKPQKKYGYYCRLHRYSGELQLTPQESALATAAKSRPPVLLNDEIRNGLANCNICPIKRQCSEFTPGHFCMIEERIIHQFIETVKEDYQVEDLDMFAVIQAGLSFINTWRIRMAQSRMDPVDAEQTRLAWSAPREMKEYTRTMKELGLTRKERIDQEKERLGLQRLPSTASLAEMMSQIQLPEGGEVTITQATQATVRKKQEDEIIDVEAADEEGS